MAASDFVTTSYAVQGGDIPYYNATGATINAGECLMVDTAHLIGASQGAVGMTPTTAVTSKGIGFAVENTPTGQTGRCRVYGVAVGIAAGAITAGDTVGGHATAGDVTTSTPGDCYVGTALSTTTTAADPVMVLVNPGGNPA
jgi:Uncharacterized conserved protein (DUF2190)